MVVINESEFGQAVESFYDGILDNLYTNDTDTTIDVLFSAWQLSLSRYEKFSFTSPFAMYEYSFIFRKQEHWLRFEAPHMIMDWNCYIIFILIIIVYFLLNTFVDILLNKDETNGAHTFWQKFVACVPGANAQPLSFTNQGNGAKKILYISISANILFFMAIFQSVLLKALLVKSPTKIDVAQIIDDLMMGRKHIISEDDITTNLIESFVGKKDKRNFVPPLVLSKDFMNENEMLNSLIKDNRMIFFGTRISIDEMLNKWPNINENCLNLVSVNLTGTVFMASLLFKKNSKYIEPFNQIIAERRQRQLNMLEQATKLPAKCHIHLYAPESERVTFKPATLTNFSGLFFTLAVIEVAGLFVLFGEKLFLNKFP